MRSVLRSMALLLAACDAPPPPEPTSAAPPAPEPAESRHLAALGTRDLPEAPDISDPITIRFDFSGTRIYAFDFHQDVANATDMGARQMEQTMTGDGSLLMKSKGGGLGTMVLKDLKSRMSMQGQDREMPIPTMVVPEVREDGGMEGGAASTQPLLKLLFPMPPKPLAKGGTAVVPLSMPFNLMGSALTVKGTGRITLTKFVRIDDRPCARLDVEIDISRLDIPEELSSKASCSVRGRSVYFWDVERKEFASGKTALLMKMRSEMAAPKLPEGSPPMPDVLKMSMVSDNLIRLTRNDALAAREK